MATRTENTSTPETREAVSRRRHYILSNGVPVHEPDLIRWAMWYEDDDNRIVARTAIGPGCEVLTDFIGIDLGRGSHAPMLWETLVREPGQPDVASRYRSRAEAEAGHGRHVARARQDRKDRARDDAEAEPCRD